MSDELFRTAPREVVDYLDRRGLRPSGSWRQFAPHEHALAFTVARTAGHDVLGDIRAAVRQAIVEQRSFQEFRKELEPILRQKGWWGTEVRDGERVLLGSTRRLRTIYAANLASARAAGEWARTQATKDVLPYLTYKISLSERRRKEHEGWVGTTLPVDHPWWRTHYPPNGWNCKCRVEQISAPAVDRVRGLKREAPPLEERVVRERESGRVDRVPKGIDPGWQRNPGVTRERVAAMLEARKLSAMPERLRELAIAAGRAGPDFRSLVETANGFDPRQAQSAQMRALARLSQPVAALPARLAARLGRDLPRVLTLDARATRKNLDYLGQGRTDRPSSAQAWGIAQEIMREPEGISPVGMGFDAWAVVDGQLWLAGVEISDGEAKLRTLYAPTDAYAAALRSGARRRDREGR